LEHQLLLLVWKCTNNAGSDALLMKKFSPTALAATLMLISGPAFAYPPVEYESCIGSALQAVYSKGLSNTLQDVEKYCDCVLTEIIDKDQPITPSINSCNAVFMQQ